MPRNLLFCTLGSGKYFAAKRENGWSHFTMAQPSLFFLYFDFTLMNSFLSQILLFRVPVKAVTWILFDK